MHQRPLDVPPAERKITRKVFSVRKKLIRWNRVPLTKQPIPLAVQHDISTRLRGEIDHLGRLLGRDLSGWLEVREGRLG